VASCSTGAEGTEAGNLEGRRGADEPGSVKMHYIISDEISLDKAFYDPDYASSVGAFLRRKVGSARISEILIEETRARDLPISLTIALAWAESGFDPLAVNRNEITVDRGLFQLNDRSFPDLREEDFFDPAVNARHGIAYLKYCLDRGTNEITALAMYNAGPRRVAERGAPQITLNYIDKILSYRNRLDEEFRESLGALAMLNGEDKSPKMLSYIVDRSRRSQ
jgi:soluble lytic murein transglycosylase-like protein